MVFIALICITINTEIEGLKRKLSSKLAANSSAIQPDWQVNSQHIVLFSPLLGSTCDIEVTFGSSLEFNMEFWH